MTTIGSGSCRCSRDPRITVVVNTHFEMMTISSTLGWFSRIITMTLELDGPMVDDTGEGDGSNRRLFMMHSRKF